MRCVHETLASHLVQMRFRRICPLVEYTMLKDVLNKGTLPNNDPQSATFAGNQEGCSGSNDLSLPIEDSAKVTHGHLCIQCPERHRFSPTPIPPFTGKL